MGVAGGSRGRREQEPPDEGSPPSTHPRQAPEPLLLDAAGLGPDHEHTEPALTTRLELAPNLAAAKVARQFVARACLDWHLGSRRPAAVAIVSELTANAVRHTGSTDLEVILALSQ
jgi:hypothetical protein